VNWNTKSMLRDCLDEPVQQRRRAALEVFVVDNGSSMARPTWSNEFPAVKLIRNDRNTGFAAANNQALRHGHGPPCIAAQFRHARP
jgi:GT2 family glycosyltransferase